VTRVRADWQSVADALSPRTQAFIGGEFRDARDGRTEPTMNPATGETIAKVAECDALEGLPTTARRCARRSSGRCWP